MKKYGFFDPYLLSFFYRPLYRDVANNWGGIAAGYLLVLLALVWLPHTFVLKEKINNFIESEGRMILQKFPDVTIQNGEVSILQSQPYIIKDPRDQHNILVIDTTGQYNTLAEAQSDMLLTKSTFYINKDNQIKSYDLSAIKDFTLTKLSLYQLMRKATLWLIFLVYPLALVVSYVYRLLQAMLFAAIGMLLVKFAKSELNYQQCLRLSIVALTPTILLATVLDLFNVSFAFQSGAYLLITLSYVMFAVSTNLKKIQITESAE